LVGAAAADPFAFADQKITTQENDTQEIEMTQSMRSQPMAMMNRMRQAKNSDVRLKLKIREFVEGKMVTIVMSLVTVFALVGDDIRTFGFTKHQDDLFYGLLTISMVLFAAEIWLNTVVIDEFKYSFFFWLDIIATLSLIIDIPWFTNIIRYTIFKYPPNYESVNAGPTEPIA
jgi:hypothetical protein|tara:strand:- start:112 stop:630 length:519 start_codon:yes stop_codon:yes gene_type:complete